MNILIIGNGFDLAHGLPTKYTDFLEFCYKIKITQNWVGGKKKFEKYHIMEDCPECIKDYLLSAFESKKSNIIN